MKPKVPVEAIMAICYDMSCKICSVNYDVLILVLIS